MVCGNSDQTLKLGAENDLFTGQRRRERQSKCIHSAAARTRECGHCAVCRDEESLPRSERHSGSFPVGVGVCVRYCGTFKRGVVR